MILPPVPAAIILRPTAWLKLKTPFRLVSDVFQDVRLVSKSGDLPLKQVHQPEYRNEVLYAETAKADQGEYKCSWTMTCCGVSMWCW